MKVKIGKWHSGCPVYQYRVSARKLSQLAAAQGVVGVRDGVEFIRIALVSKVEEVRACTLWIVTILSDQSGQM